MESPKPYLCAYCSQINFEALRNPSTSDLAAIQEGRTDTTRHPFKDKRDDAHTPASLGRLRDISQRSSTCGLCRLIVKTVSRQSRDVSIKDMEDLICQAETTFYGIYRDPQGKHYWVRRLSILIDHESPRRRSIYFAFQACDIGATDVNVNQSFVDPRADRNMMVFGGRRRPLQLDLTWVKRWIMICQSDHGDVCEKADAHLRNDTVEMIRFINVRDRNIHTFSSCHISNYSFIALSYVWGHTQNLTLRTSKAMELAEAGALSADLLPRTIEDTIVLARALDIEWVWIDALCILQDDKGDKKVQIGNMSRIYSSAFLTVIAASATGANDGLPGLHPWTRSTEQEEVIVVPDAQPSSYKPVLPGFSLMTTLRPQSDATEHYLEHTPWRRRGWTMQERVMSRRALVFTQEQVYWLCRETTFCEESYNENKVISFNRFHENALEPTLTRSFRNFYEPEDADVRLWKVFQNLVAAYTRRTFTYHGDVFDAFLAILQGISTISGETFLWGIPRSHFEQGLLWDTFTGQHRRKELSTLPMTAKNVQVTFPSWSWMGWIGETSICIGDDHFDIDIGEIPEILCFQHKNAPLRIEKVRKSAIPYERSGRLASGAWTANSELDVSLADIALHYPSLQPAQLESIPEDQILFFWASSASFDLEPASNNPKAKKPMIVTDSGKQVGTVNPVTVEHLKDGPFDRGKHEFLVLGTRRNAFWDPKLLVIQIVWHKGIAYRVNCGEIEEDAWLSHPSRWILIALG